MRRLSDTAVAGNRDGRSAASAVNGRGVASLRLWDLAEFPGVCRFKKERTFAEINLIRAERTRHPHELRARSQVAAIRCSHRHVPQDALHSSFGNRVVKHCI